VEDARTLVVSPWDKSAVSAVEKAILKSDLGLTPNTAGQVIRLPLPPMTEERRKELTKVAKHEAESARVAVRAVRHDLMNELKEMLKERLISEDENRRGQEEIQKLTDRHVHDIDQVLAEKEKELLQV
jgi:ribosome recycling factor